MVPPQKREYDEWDRAMGLLSLRERGQWHDESMAPPHWIANRCLVVEGSMDRRDGFAVACMEEINGSAVGCRSSFIQRFKFTQ
jgi:hypothetical protein